MTKMKSYTDLEQSKKLAEILPLESADMCYKCVGEDPYDVVLRPYSEWKEEYKGLLVGKEVDVIPCWSLAALMNLLPSEFTEKGEYSETTYKIDIRKYALTDDVDIYQIAYGNYRWFKDGSNIWVDMVNSGEREELIDAVFQMICWLKENDKL
jgi:hypothetical protein